MRTCFYYISFNNTTWTQFYPSNEPVIKCEQEPGEIFFRNKVDSFHITKRLNPSLYDILQGLFFTPGSFGTEIYYRIDINGVTKFRFIDTIRAGNLDSQNSVYECTPGPDDDYQPILNLYQKKWDNPTLLFGLSETLFYPTLSSVPFANGPSPDGFDSFSDISGVVSYTNNGTPYYNYADKDVGLLPASATITVIVSALSYTGMEPRMKLVNASGTQISNEVYITANGIYQLTLSTTPPATAYIRLSEANLTGASRGGTFTYQAYTPTETLAGASLYNLLDRIIGNSLYYFKTNYDIVSTILWNDPLPTNPPEDIETYITANPTNDYVIEDTAIFNYLKLTRADSFTTSKEDNVELCLKDIMDILKSKRLWWFIDDDGKFRIEHDKYFRSYNPQADLTSVTYAPYKPEVDKLLFNYAEQNYNQINIIEDNISNKDWTPGMKIEYDPLITGDQVQDQRTSVTTDIKNLIDNPDSASSSGLTLLRCDSGGNILWDKSLVTADTYYPNEKLSPAWISTNYMNYFAEALQGTIFSGAHTFVHVRETLKQTGVKFKYSDLDWKRPFTLTIGEGWLSSAEYYPETGFYSLDVVYNPYAVINPYTIPTTYQAQVVYGFLYNWYAATDARGIANTGWHVPTKDEFDTLIIYLGGDTVAGGKLKETGLIYWDTPNTGATNEVGFNGRGSGSRDNSWTGNWTYNALNIATAFWSQTAFDAGDSYFIELFNDNATVLSDYPPNKWGISVRLIKNDSTDSGTYIGNDGKIYSTVKIGTQVWLAENLCETKYRNGDPIPEVTDNTAWAALTTGARCSYNNDESNAIIQVPINSGATADTTTITTDSTTHTSDETI